MYLTDDGGQNTLYILSIAFSPDFDGGSTNGLTIISYQLGINAILRIILLEYLLKKRHCSNDIYYIYLKLLEVSQFLSEEYREGRFAFDDGKE